MAAQDSAANRIRPLPADRKDLTMPWNCFSRLVVEPIEDLAQHFKQLVNSLPEGDLVVMSHQQTEVAIACTAALVCGLMKKQTDLTSFLEVHGHLQRVRTGQVLGADILPGLPDGNSSTEKDRSASNRLQSKFNHYSKYLFWIDAAIKEVAAKPDRATTVENIRAAFLRTMDLRQALFPGYENHNLEADFKL
jgi:hypothetical protein